MFVQITNSIWTGISLVQIKSMQTVGMMTNSIATINGSMQTEMINEKMFANFSMFSLSQVKL